MRGVTIRTTMAYTVKQLAQLAGVSIRTLHHYDEIGLLTPPVIGANGYRYYDERSALRLQSILFYRDLEFRPFGFGAEQLLHADDACRRDAAVTIRRLVVRRQSAAAGCRTAWRTSN